MNCRPQNGTESYTAPKSEDMRAPHARRHNLWCAHTQQYHHPSRLDIRQDLALRPMLIRRTHTAKHRPTSDCVGWYLFQTMLVMFRTMLRKVRIGYSVRYCCCKVWVRHGMFVGLINSISPGLLGCPQSRGGGGCKAERTLFAAGHGYMETHTAPLNSVRRSHCSPTLLFAAGHGYMTTHTSLLHSEQAGMRGLPSHPTTLKAARAGA